MKHHYLLFFFGLCSITLQAQQQVVATSGNAIQNSLGSISWTIGEPVVTTLESGDKVLNQGFQQSSLILKAESLNSESAISIWPNPTCNWVTLSVDNPEQMLCQLFDIQGKLLQSKVLTDKTTDIDFSLFASGTYLIKVINGEKESETFNIIKQ